MPQTQIEYYIEAFNMTTLMNPNLLACLRLFTFPEYSNVFIQQAEQHFLYFLVEGEIQCNHYHPNGKLAVLALSRPFSVIGDLEILRDEKINSNVITTRPTTMLALTNTEVERYGADDPRFLRLLIHHLQEKLYESGSLHISQVLPLRGQLASYILSQPPHTDQGHIVLPDKETLAALLGTTPRHLNRTLKDLVDDGIIDDGYPRICVKDRPRLQKIMNQ